MEPSTKEYLNETEISLIYGTPNNYKNKYVKLTGKVVEVKFDNKGQTIYAVTDIENFTNEIVVYLDNKTVAIKEGDYISVDGYIKVATKTTDKPYIIGKEVKVISYLEAAVPTKKLITVDKSVTQHNVTVTIQKVEFGDKETRVYLKVQNNSNVEFSLYEFMTILTQNSKQYQTQSSRTSQELSNKILPGGNSEGIIVFSKIDQSNFTLTSEGHSSDYNVEFENFVFDIAV